MNNNTHHGRILVVDDNPKFLKHLDSDLKREGYEVIPANGGYQALIKLEQVKPDLVLVDVNMPEMSGLELLEELNLKAPEIPVVLMTAYSSEDIAINAVNKHASGYIIKPFRSDEIHRIVQKNIRPRQEPLANNQSLEGVSAFSLGSLLTQISKLQQDKQVLEKNNSKLREQCIRDGLTQLYNHMYFQERLEKEFERSLRYGTDLALIMLDVDNFKAVNDQYGHQQGDVTLIQLARLIQETLRSIDIAARYGGEEFAIILPQINVEGAKHSAERLRQRVQEYFCHLNHPPIQLSISQGIAVIPDPNIKTKADLIQAADQLLYNAKRHGRNRLEIAASKDSA